MDYNKLELFVSQPRLNRFLAACGNSKRKAQQLYRINLRVAQAFYPVLNLFEVFLRNSINNQVTAHFANPNWIVTEKHGFMSDSSLARGNYFLRGCVDSAERKIRRNRGTVTYGKVIAEQTFGFWTSLFDPHHYSLIGGSVIHAFPHKFPHANRSVISAGLQGIRDFRNRVYHNEPICFNHHAIDFTPAHNIKTEIFLLLSWMDADLSNYVDYFDSIDSKITQVNNL